MELPLVGEPVNHVAVIVFSVFGWLTLLSGILGNGFLLLVLATQRKLWEIHNIFIANLALADIVVVCSGLPFLLLDLLLGYHPVVSLLHCKINAFILSLAYCASILSLIFVSFNRYMKVCHPIRYPATFTLPKSLLYLLLLWLLGGLIQVPLLAGYPPFGYDTGAHSCQGRSQKKEFNYGGMAMSAVLVGPVFLIGYFNYSIFHTWNQSRARVKRDRGGVKTGARVATRKEHTEFDCLNDLEPVDGPLTQTTTGMAGDESRDSKAVVGVGTTSTPQTNNSNTITASDNGTATTATTTSSTTTQTVPTPSAQQPMSGGQRSHAAQKVDVKTKRTTRSEMSLIRSLLVIAICLFVLYLPFAVCVLLDYGLDVPAVAMVMSALLLYVNCAVNWIIYGAMNTSFREAYIRTLHGLGCRCCTV